MAVGNSEKNQYECTYCKKVIFILFLEKEINQDLSGGNSIRCKATSPRAYGNACGPETCSGREKEHYLIVFKF